MEKNKAAEQIKAFKKKHPLNFEGLKQYVTDDPNHKIAWYLLGREYARMGDEAMAKYCYAQSDEFYPIVESDPQPGPQRYDAAADPAPRKAASPRWVRILFVTVWGLFFLLYAAGNRQYEEPASLPDDGAFQAQTAQPNGEQGMEPEDRIAVSDEGAAVYYALGGPGSESLQRALNEIVLPGENGFKQSVVSLAQWSKDQHWILWSAPAQIVFSAERSQSDGSLKLAYHDRQLCQCRPADSTAARKLFSSWQKQQEQRLVLRSAVSAFQRLEHRIPQSVEEMSRDYPNNLLPGFTSWMKRMFEGIAADGPDGIRTVAPANRPAEEDAGKGAEQDAESRRSDGASSPAAAYSQNELLDQPLKIIVDKSNHRLALVSGQVILRNYAVGLGGKRTPVGEFEITEKVRNPNGRDDGDFGSRGMTLSQTLYAIHGTNQPASIGKDLSNGCIRMLKDDVEELFDMAPLGTKVIIQSGGLPSEQSTPSERFALPRENDETNPGKVYRWLN